MGCEKSLAPTTIAGNPDRGNVPFRGYRSTGAAALNGSSLVAFGANFEFTRVQVRSCTPYVRQQSRQGTVPCLPDRPFPRFFRPVLPCPIRRRRSARAAPLIQTDARETRDYRSRG